MHEIAQGVIILHCKGELQTQTNRYIFTLSGTLAIKLRLPRTSLSRAEYAEKAGSLYKLPADNGADYFILAVFTLLGAFG